MQCLLLVLGVGLDVIQMMCRGAAELAPVCPQLDVFRHVLTTLYETVYLKHI